MSNIAFLIICIILFPTLAILAILISITTFIRGHRAQLHTLHRLRSLEQEFIVLVKTLENTTFLADDDRRTMRTLENRLREAESVIGRRVNQGIFPARGEEATYDQSMNRALDSQLRGLSASRATTQSRRTGGLSHATFSRHQRSSGIPRPAIQRSNAQTHQEPAITITAPRQTRLPRPAHPTASGSQNPHISPQQTPTYDTQIRSISVLFHILLSVEPALSTQQIVSIIENFHNALQTSEREESHESSHNPFADPSRPSTQNALLNRPRSPSSTLVDPPSPSSSFNFRSVFDTPPSSSTSLSGNTLIDSLSGTTLVNSDGSDSDDASLLMRSRPPRTYSRYSRYEELMLQRSNSILTPAQLAQVEGWEEELRAADGWVNLEEESSEEESMGEEDLGA